ncbi:MAG: hypothetical protein R3C54_02640 [Parvularculaceae bacterium]
MRIGEVLLYFLSRPQDVGDALFAPKPTGFAESVAIKIIVAISPIFALALATILSLIAQRAVTFAPSKLIPKFSRLSSSRTQSRSTGRRAFLNFEEFHQARGDHRHSGLCVERQIS